MTTIASRHAIRHGLNTLAAAIGIALLGIPVATQAQTVPDARAGQYQPGTDTAANGTPVVNIVAPSARGVSRNQFQSFNVGNQGLILNNSSGISQTQLAGVIVGNTNLAAGQSARIILSEVTGTSATALNGYTEVAGNAADVIIANPNGISVNGGGFINTNRSVLTTGTPVFGGDGSLQAFRVTRGAVSINGAGLDATGVDRLDVIARTVQANAKVWARDLNVVTGANQVDYFNLAVQGIQGEGSTPGVSLDVAALGGMYADKIRLLGTEAGVGVRNDGEIVAQAGDFQLTSSGQLVTGGTLSASGNLAIDAGGLDNSGTLVAGASVTARSAGDFVNAGTLYAAQGGTFISAGSITNTGTVRSAQNGTFISAGNLVNAGKLYAASGALDITAAGMLALSADSDVFAGKAVAMRAAELANSGTIEAATNLDLRVGGHLSNQGFMLADTGSAALAGDSLENSGTVSVAGTAQLTATQAVQNAGIVVVAGDTMVHAAQVTNAGQWQSTGAFAISSGALDNLGLMSGMGDVLLDVGRMDTSDGSTLSAARDLTVHAQAASSVAGVLQAGRDLVLTSGGALDLGAHAALRGAHNLALESTGALSNAGEIYAGSVASVRASSLTNAGTLRADGALQATISGDTSNDGSLLSAGDLTLDAGGAFANAGKLYAIGGGLNVTAGASMSNAGSGDVYAGQGLLLRASSMFNAGAMESVTAMTLLSQGSLRNAGSLLASSGDIALSGSTIGNDGAINAAGTATLSAGTTLDSTGIVVGGNDLVLSGQAVNLQGQLQAGRDIQVQAASLANASSMHALRDIRTGGGNISNAAASSMFADGNMTLANTGTLINRGTLHAGQDFASADIVAFDNGDAGIVQAGHDVTLSTRGLMTNAGVISATALLTVQAGTLSNSGLLRSGAMQRVTVDGDASNAGTAYADDDALWQVGGLLASAGTLAARGNLNIDAASVAATGVLGAGVQSDGSIAGSGALRVTSTGMLAANGHNLAAGALSLHGNALDLAGAISRAGSSMTLTADHGAINLGQADLATNGDLVLQADGQIDNSGGKLQAGHVSLDASGLVNRGGQLLQTGRAASTLHVSGVLDNAQGSIASNGAQLALQAASLINTNGDIAHAGSGGLSLQTTGVLDNSVGAIASNGSVQIVTAGALRNVGGTVLAAGDLTAAAQSLDNTSGELVGDALDISLLQSMLNTGGIVQASRALLLRADGLANGTGQIKALGADDLSLYISGSLNIATSGLIAGNGAVNLHAGSIINAGQVYAGGDLLVASTGALDNRSGALQAMGDVSVGAGGALDNSLGRIEAGSGRSDAQLTLSAAALDNSAGRIANVAQGISAINLGSGALTNNSGTLGGQGDVAISAGSISNTSNGTVFAGRDLILNAAGLDNTSGTLYAASNVAWTNRLASLTNAQGHVGAGGNLALTLAALDNSAGETAANADVTLDLGSFTGSGRVVAGNDLSLTLPGDFSNVVGTTLMANHNATLNLGGRLSNAAGAALNAVNALTVHAAAIDNAAGGTINSASTWLDARGNLANAGRIEGDLVTIDAAAVDNTGTLIGGTVIVHAQNLTNGSDLGTVTDNPAYDSAVIAATGNVGLYVTGGVLNRDALIYAMGDLTIAGNASGVRAGAITNQSGSIEAEGDMLLAADQITNQRRVFDTATHVLDAGEQTQNGTSEQHPLDPDSDPETVAYCGSGLPNNNWRCRPGSNPLQLTTSVVTSTEQLSRISAEGRIVAGADISLGGSVLNDKSTIAAGGNLRINGQPGGVDDGTTTVGGETIRNVGWVPTAVVASTVDKSIQVQHHDVCGGGLKRCWNDNRIDHYGQHTDTVTIALTPGSIPAWVQLDPGPDAPSRISAGLTLAIHGTTIDNTTVGADGHPVNTHAALGSNTAASTIAGAAAGRVADVAGGSSVGTVDAPGAAPSIPSIGAVTAPTGTVPDAGPAPGGQTVGSIDAPAGQLQLPAGGLFTTHPGASSGYLVETDPRFASMSGFYGSDYLMDRLSWNGEETLKRLGDAFYENRLVLDQITALTGRRLLSDSTDALAQYRELMDGGVAAAKQFDLTVGVALTAQQMASLTGDIVWLVSQQVDGESVLVPVVYLSAAHAQQMSGERGAVLAGKDIILDASGNLTNTGSVLASRDASLKAGTLLNSGNLSAGNALSIVAAQDILNTGRIQGGNVAVVAGRDVLSGADIGKVDLGGVNLGATLSPADAQRLGLATGGSITASGNLAVQAGRDLVLGQAPISAGRDLSLVAGRDLTATAAPISAGGDAALMAGRDLSLAALAQTTLSGDRTSLTSTTTHTVSIVSAGGNLALVSNRDINSAGASLKAGNTLAVSAGRDVTLNAVSDVVTNKEHHKEGRTSVSTSRLDEKVLGSTLGAGNGMVVSAGRDLTTSAATLGSSDGAIALGAGRDVTLNSGVENQATSRDTKHKKSGLLSSKTTTTHDATQDQRAVGTSLDGTAITIAAAHDVVTAGAQLTAVGAVALSAGHDVILGAAQDSHSEQHDRHTTQRGGGLGVLVGTSKGDLFTRTAKTQHDASSDTTAVGSLLSGDTVTVAAGRDLTTQAAQIAGTHDVVLAAGHNLTVGTAENTHTEDHSLKVSTSGFQRSGLHAMAGVSKAKQTGNETDTTPTGSVIGSTDGSVTLSAGQDVHITASDVISQTGTAIVGQNVTIDAGVGTADSHQTQSLHTAGIMAGLTGGAASQAEQAWASGQRAGQAKDKRLAALYAAQALYGAKDAFGAGSAGVTSAQSGQGTQGAANASGTSLRIGIGASSASAHSDSHDDIAYASHIRSAGDVTIAATNGDLNVIGSQITGQSVALAASHNLNLLSQAEEHSQKDSSANASGEIGYSMGAQTGFYVSASAGRGSAHGNGITHSETTIGASDTVSLISGNDATIKGAQLKGNSVTAAIGHNLLIESEQDTNDYASKQQQVGGTFVYGSGGSVTYDQQKAKEHDASVREQSGIVAGAGGFQFQVGNDTRLKGGLIASAAGADQNTLSTGTLVAEDMHNEASASSQGMGISVDSSMTSKYGMAKGIASNVLDRGSASGASSGETRSAIGPADLIITDEQRQRALTNQSVQEALAALNRNTADANVVAQTQDLAKLQEQAEAQRLVKRLVYSESVKFTDEAYRTMFLEKATVHEVAYDAEGKPIPGRELSEDEKLNLKPGADGKIHIANNGIFNDEAASAKYAAQNGNAQGVQYYIYFPEADNSLSELLVAGYQKSLENDFMGLTNATQETKGFMLQYGQQGLELDGHSRGSMTVGNAMESLMKRDDAKGLLSGTTISFFGPAYNVFKADDELSYLQNREVASSEAQRQSMVLTFENHVADPVGRWIGGNPATGGSIPVGSSWVRELLKVTSGKYTVHNCYGAGGDNCSPYWSESFESKPTLRVVRDHRQ